MESKRATDNLTQTRAGAAFVVRKLREAGHDTFFVGGAVRDALLQRPIREYDIATSALPDQVIATFKRTVPVGVQFGVVLVITRDGEYEVATFRAETSYTDGRRPDEVRFVSAREDVLRRDFTINGLLQDPETETIEDYVNGRGDLEARLIRAIGVPEERFQEDHLRILRAIRFATCLRFDIETKTLQAAIDLAHTVNSVAAERIQAELKRTFTEGEPFRAYTLLSLTGVLTHILPELEAQGTHQSAVAFESVGSVSFPEALSLLWPDEAAMPEQDIATMWAERLKLSRNDRDQLRYLLSNRQRPEASTTRAQQLRFIREPHFDSFCKVELARRTATNTPTEPITQLRALAEHTPAEALRPRPLLNGRDLKALGYPPGPHFKQLLNTLEDAQLEGRVSTKDEAFALVSSLYDAM